MQASLIKKAFGSKNPFDMEYQKKKVKKDRIANAISDSEFNWMTETIPGRDADEYTINYHRCGLCALGKQEHLEELIPICVPWILFLLISWAVCCTGQVHLQREQKSVISIFAKRTLNGIKKENTDSNPSCKNRES